jgi:hypothetical protein
VIDAARDVTDNFVDAIDKSIKKRPYTTLALFAVVGLCWARRGVVEDVVVDRVVSPRSITTHSPTEMKKQMARYRRF